MAAPDLVIAVPAALAAASSFGASSYLQARASHRAPRRRPGDPALFWDLVRSRVFGLAVLMSIVGFGLQVLALRFGPVLMVQPLLVLSLLVYVLVAPLAEGRRPDGPTIFGAALTVAGLTFFLLVGRPSDAGGDLDLSTVLPLSIGLGGALVLLLAGTSRTPERYRPLPLAVATGICYGVTATLVRSLSGWFGQGFVGVLHHWQVYVICIVGPLGVLLNQNTYQAGNVVSPSLAIITTLDPLVSIMLGLLWLHGTMTVGVGPVMGEVVAMAVMVSGVVVLAHRAPQVIMKASR